MAWSPFTLIASRRIPIPRPSPSRRSVCSTKWYAVTCRPTSRSSYRTNRIFCHSSSLPWIILPRRRTNTPTSWRGSTLTGSGRDAAARRLSQPEAGELCLRVIRLEQCRRLNEEGVAVQITITPPPWETWWFRGIVLLVIVGTVIGAYGCGWRSIEGRSRELVRQVEDRTAELSRPTCSWNRRLPSAQRTEEALAQERASAAVAAERNRIARELHDSATQSLYAVTLYADAATRLLASGRADSAAENLLKLRGQPRKRWARLRMLIFELRPPILAEQGLASALGARLEAVEGRAGLKTELHVTAQDRLPPHVEEGLYRIAVEALNNALRHAQAHCISVP